MEIPLNKDKNVDISSLLNNKYHWLIVNFTFF